MFRRHDINSGTTHEKNIAADGIRYLYWGLTGARFGRSSKNREQPPNQAPHQTWPNLNPQPADTEQPAESSTSQRIARLIAERDSARYERELEIDYRETLLRDLEMLRVQLDEAQRRIMELEDAGHTPQPAQRQALLEQELVQAQKRIEQLEDLVNKQEHPSGPAAQHPANQEEMMDIFLQFVGSHDRRDDTQI